MTRHIILFRPLSTFLIGCVAIAVTTIVPAVAVEPITEKPWREAVLSVTDLDVTARFSPKLGGMKRLIAVPYRRQRLSPGGYLPQRVATIGYSARLWGVTLGRFDW
jgi:hypothetical protein